MTTELNYTRCAKGKDGDIQIEVSASDSTTQTYDTLSASVNCSMSDLDEALEMFLTAVRKVCGAWK